MFKMVLRRLGMLVGVLLGVTVITFLILHLVPGDPAQLIAGPHAGAEAVAKVRAQLGLDRPHYAQYMTYLDHLLHGDLGVSVVTHRPVLTELFEHFPATVEIMLSALLISIILAVILGVLSAVYADSWVDHVLRIFAITGVSTPQFVIGLLLLLLFYGELNLLPGSGQIDPALMPPPHITGMLLIDSLLTGNLAAFGNVVSHMVMPTLTLSFATLGGFMRLVRTSMLDALHEDYVRTARAMGLGRWTVILRYALRNALMPLVTVGGLAIGSLLFGSIVVETIFAWPGAGSYVLSAIFALDFPVIMGFAVIVSTVYVLANLAVDLIYLAIDPRIREIG